MAVASFSRKKFEREIGKMDREMENKIAMFGTPVEAVTDNEVQIEVFPNRPDLLSYSGFKIAFLAYLGKATGLKTYKINKPEKNYVVNVDKSVLDIRPFTACAIVKGIKFDDEKIKEIIDLQEKLAFTLGRKRKKLGLGIYPLDKIQLPITYKAMEPDQIKFVPLEFNKELSGLEILQRHPTGKEYAHLLAGKAKFPIFVDSSNQVLSMPPIINSHLTGRVTEKTEDVFIECTGTDLEAVNKSLNIFVMTFAEMGGKVYQMQVGKAITPDLSTKKQKISVENTNKLLGIDLKEKDMKKLIERMGFNYSDGYAEAPSWRTDILHEVDIIEDIAIAYGYENLVPEIPSISTIGEIDFKEKLKDKISQILSGLSMIEVSNYHLTTKKDQLENMDLPEKNHGLIELEGSKTEFSLLRKDLSHYLLKNLSENIDSEYPQEIFEMGKVFNLDKITQSVSEKESIAGAASPGNFTRVKQVLEYLFRMIGKEISFKEAERIPSHFIEGRTAEILINGKKAGLIGEIHPKTLDAWKIKMPVALFEFDLDLI